jgi:hypothetical protein
MLDEGLNVSMTKKEVELKLSGVNLVKCYVIYFPRWTEKSHKTPQ